MEIGKKLKEARLNKDLTKKSLLKNSMFLVKQYPIGKMKNLILIL